MWGTSESEQVSSCFIIVFFNISLISYINDYLCNVFTPKLRHEVEGVGTDI